MYISVRFTPTWLTLIPLKELMTIFILSVTMMRKSAIGHTTRMNKGEVLPYGWTSYPVKLSTPKQGLKTIYGEIKTHPCCLNRGGKKFNHKL